MFFHSFTELTVKSLMSFTWWPKWSTAPSASNINLCMCGDPLKHVHQKLCVAQHICAVSTDAQTNTFCILPDSSSNKLTVSMNLTVDKSLCVCVRARARTRTPCQNMVKQRRIVSSINLYVANLSYRAVWMFVCVRDTSWLDLQKCRWIRLPPHGPFLSP